MQTKYMSTSRKSLLFPQALIFLSFSHRKKRMKQLSRKIKSGTLDVNEDDPFELFIAATNIRYCYYSETHKILGNTYGMCVLQVRIVVILDYLVKSLWVSNEILTFELSSLSLYSWLSIHDLLDETSPIVTVLSKHVTVV